MQRSTWLLVVCDRAQNANFWLVCVAYSMSVSIYGVWSSLFGVILKDVMNEVIALIIIISSSSGLQQLEIASRTVVRMSDL